MAVIYSYPQVSAVDGTELLICSQTSSNNATRSMTTAAFGAYISAAYGPGGSIYLANGTLSGDRALVGGGNSLTFSGLSLFTVASPVELGSTFKLTTGASLNHVLTSDASGNATWAAPAVGSFTGLTDTPLLYHPWTNAPVTVNAAATGLRFNGEILAIFGGTGITSYAVGDMLYADSVSTLTKLVAGTDTHVLTLAAGVPTWAAPAGGVTSVTGTTPIASSGGTTPAISISAATTGAAGSMSAADKTKLDGIATGAQPGTITSVTGTAPVVSSGGTTPAISMPISDATTDGYLRSTNFVSFFNKATYYKNVTLITSGTVAGSASDQAVPGLTFPIPATKDGDYIVYAMISVDIENTDAKPMSLMVFKNGVKENYSETMDYAKKDEHQSLQLTYAIDGLVATDVIAIYVNNDNVDIDVILHGRLLLQSWNT